MKYKVEVKWSSTVELKDSADLIFKNVKGTLEIQFVKCDFLTVVPEKWQRNVFAVKPKNLK